MAISPLTIFGVDADQISTILALIIYFLRYLVQLRQLVGQILRIAVLDLL